MTEIPIAMVLLNLVLPHARARWANLAAAAFTVAYVLGMGSMTTPALHLHRRHRDARVRPHRVERVEGCVRRLRGEARTGALVTE